MKVSLRRLRPKFPKRNKRGLFYFVGLLATSTLIYLSLGNVERFSTATLKDSRQLEAGLGRRRCLFHHFLIRLVSILANRCTPFWLLSMHLNPQMVLVKRLSLSSYVRGRTLSRLCLASR